MSDRKIVFSVQKSPDGGYEARAVGHSIFTQAETLEELKRNAEDAVRAHFGDEETPRAVRFVDVPPFRFGCAKGEFTVPDDFNDPDPEIEEMFYEGALFPEENDISGK